MTRLLIGYDGSDCARSAVSAAGALFRGADATVAHVRAEPLRPEQGAMARIALPSDVLRAGIEEIGRQALERARERAEEGAALAREAGLHASAVTLTGDRPWRALLAVARDADVLVCGTRGRGAVERATLGSTASSLVHHTQVPLLVAGAEAASLDGPLVAGYDGSDGAQVALAFAAEHLRGRPLVVATMWHSPVRHSLSGHAFMESPIALLHEYAQGIDDICAEISEGTATEGAERARSLGLDARSLTVETAHGEWRGLLGVARDTGAAALLVGSRGLGAVTGTVLGSVTSRLVHSAAMPVLIVPWPDA